MELDDHIAAMGGYPPETLADEAVEATLRLLQGEGPGRGTAPQVSEHGTALAAPSRPNTVETIAVNIVTKALRYNPHVPAEKLAAQVTTLVRRDERLDAEARARLTAALEDAFATEVGTE